MTRPALNSVENSQKPILIVDKRGDFGEALAREISSETLVVYVSQKTSEGLTNVVCIPFEKKTPTIPDNHYSHIFLIDESFDIANHILDVFIKKAQSDNSFLVLCINANKLTPEFIKSYTASYNRAKIAILGDVFLKDGIYDPKTEINKILIGIKKDGRIKITEDATMGVSPVFFDDAILGILETVFGNVENENIFYIFPKHKITLLTLAHMFQKKDPDLKIDFTSEKLIDKDNFSQLEKGTFILGDNYKIEDRIKKIEFDKINILKFAQEKVVDKKNKFGFSFSLKSLLFFFVLMILTPLVMTVIFYFIGQGSLLNLKNNIERGDLRSAGVSASVAYKSFVISEQSSNIVLFESSIILQSQTVNKFIQKIDAWKNISYATSSIVDASSNMKNYFTPDTRSTESFSDVVSKLKNALFIYNKEKQSGIFPQSIVNKLSGLADFASSTIDFWPEMLGFNGAKNYLILFENNMELRPGGGFIGSYGILSLNSGKTSLKIYDVYDADGQLKEHVEPPYPIRRYLPSSHWFLRDSNFDADFSKGAVASAVFLNKEMKQSVDGVIGVDLSFVRNILSVVGPVKIFDYNETVDADNFFQITKSHTEKDFFPGSTQKKDFLKSFYNALSLKLAEDKNVSYLNLINAITSSIYEKHVVFTFNNINEQANFSVNGWSSTLSDLRPKKKSRINDFIGISEANLGGNKANYYVTRSISQKVSLNTNGSILENLEVSFKNTAPNSLGNKGVYTNYLRFILPLGSKLSAVKIDGKDQKITNAITDPSLYEKKGFIPPDGVEVYQLDEGNYSIYGFLIGIMPGDLKKVQVDYALSQKFDPNESDFSYSIKIFKQPGIDSIPYDLSLDPGPGIKMISTDKEIIQNGQLANLSTQITRDREVNVSFSRK